MEDFCVPTGAEEKSPSEVCRIGFLLLPEFPMYALIPAIEALRVANQKCGSRLYSWHLFSSNGAPVRAGSGMQVPVENSITAVERFPNVFVCAGNQPVQWCTKPLLNWLRRLARHGSVLGAIDTGVFALAAAELLDGYRVTLHWEAIPMFRNLYPEIEVSEQLFIIDRRRVSCAGGHAALDLMLHLIGRRHGFDLAQIIANGFVSQRVRGDSEPQRLSSPNVSSGSRTIIENVLRVMEGNLETPLSLNRLAVKAGVSPSTLDRIFRIQFGKSPMRYYRKARMLAARNRLFYADDPICEVAASCGFSCPEVFSRAFRQEYGISPSDFRRRFTHGQLRQFRPELERPLGSGE